MKVINLSSNNQDDVVAKAVDVIKRGGSIVYPTDTIYGLGVNPFDDFAVRRLFRIKKRPISKPVPLIIKNMAMAKKLAYIDSQKEKILRSIWPGAVSSVLYKRGLISSFISAGTGTVSLRIPNNKFCVKVVQLFNGPITSTSANISGERHASDIRKIINRFKVELYKPDLIIDAGILESKQPSTVLDLTHEKPRILRVGPVKPRELSKILEV